MNLLKKKEEVEGAFEECKAAIKDREQKILSIQEEIQAIYADMNKLQGQYMLIEELMADEEKAPLPEIAVE